MRGGEGIVRGEGGEQNRQKNCQNVLAAIFVQLIGVWLPGPSNALLLSPILFVLCRREVAL